MASCAISTSDFIATILSPAARGRVSLNRLPALPTGAILLCGELLLRRRYDVLHEHGDGEQADAARHGRDGARDLRRASEIDVADELPARVLRIGRQAVDADVDDRRAGLHHVRLDEARPPDRCDEDVRPARHGGEVFRMAVADRHRRVLAQEHHRGRFADDEASSHDHRAPTGYFNIIMLQHVDARFGGAGREADALVGIDAGHRILSYAVDVLLRRKGAAERPVVDVRRQGAQYQRAVDIFIDAYSAYRGQYLLFADVGGEKIFFYLDAGGGAAFFGASFVSDVVGVLPHAHYCEDRHKAAGAQPFALALEMRIQRIYHGFSL